MSLENVELIRAVFRGWDEEGVDGILKFFHDDEYLDRTEALKAAGLSA